MEMRWIEDIIFIVTQSVMWWWISLNLHILYHELSCINIEYEGTLDSCGVLVRGFSAVRIYDLIKDRTRNLQFRSERLAFRPLNWRPKLYRVNYNRKSVLNQMTNIWCQIYIHICIHVLRRIVK